MLKERRFQRRKEDFNCIKCGFYVSGDGYTNHCPECFSSQHVDVKPGDRAAECGGIMFVADIQLEHGDWIIKHTCEKCGYSKRNKVHANDNMNKLSEIQTRLNEELLK
ncbi:MAG: RNHCP domain-containing protein [bacterium]|nr:RNHCP domain-containing protein [bacterium]